MSRIYHGIRNKLLKAGFTKVQANPHAGRAGAKASDYWEEKHAWGTPHGSGSWF